MGRHGRRRRAGCPPGRSGDRRPTPTRRRHRVAEGGRAMSARGTPPPPTFARAGTGPVLEVDSLCVRYGNVVALNDVSFTVARGAVTGADRSQRRREDDADRRADRATRAPASGHGRVRGRRHAPACVRTGWRGAGWSAPSSRSSCSTTSPSRRTSRSPPSRPACSGRSAACSAWAGRAATRTSSWALSVTGLARRRRALSHRALPRSAQTRRRRPGARLPPVAAAARRARRRAGHRRDAGPRPPPAVAARARRHRAADRPRHGPRARCVRPRAGARLRQRDRRRDARRDPREPRGDRGLPRQLAEDPMAEPATAAGRRGPAHRLPRDPRGPEPVTDRRIRRGGRACSAPTAPARRRRCRRSPACSSRSRARSGSPTRRSPAARPTVWRGSGSSLVPEDRALFYGLTVRENLSLARGQWVAARGRAAGDAARAGEVPRSQGRGPVRRRAADARRRPRARQPSAAAARRRDEPRAGPGDRRAAAARAAAGRRRVRHRGAVRRAAHRDGAGDRRSRLRPQPRRARARGHRGGAPRPSGSRRGELSRRGRRSTSSPSTLPPRPR